MHSDSFQETALWIRHFDERTSNVRSAVLSGRSHLCSSSGVQRVPPCCREYKINDPAVRAWVFGFGLQVPSLLCGGAG